MPEPPHDDAAQGVVAPACGLGITIATYGFRWRSKIVSPAYPSFTQALDVLQHCHRLGGAGVQVGVAGWNDVEASQLRAYAEKSGLYLEGQIRLPADAADLPRFENELRMASAAGVKIVRTVMLSGRRYETFTRLADFAAFKDKAWASLLLAEPVAAKAGVRLALENHKDCRVNELLDIIRRLGSAHVGICLDTGNSLALLEDLMEVVRSYAPWTITCHFKDMGVQAFDGGFLLAEVPLGTGFLDLREMIRVIRQGNPQAQFNLEMITRDPLQVPCLTDNYWPTFPETPASVLARALALVRDRAPQQPLPTVSHLAPEEKLRVEENNVVQSFAHAREHLLPTLQPRSDRGKE